MLPSCQDILVCSARFKLTCPYVCALLGEEASVVLPFRSVSVHRPTLAELCYAVSGEDLLCRTVDVVGNDGLALLGRNVVKLCVAAHLGCLYELRCFVDLGGNVLKLNAECNVFCLVVAWKCVE